MMKHSKTKGPLCESHKCALVNVLNFISFFTLGLKEYSSKKEPTTSMAIYNGQHFVLHLGFYSFINNLKVLWRYGISVFKMSRYVGKQLKQFKTIYQLQASGKSYKTVPDLLRAMGDTHEFFQQTQITCENYLTSGLNWQPRMVDELVCAAMKTNYGQNNHIDAFTAFVSLAGIQDGSLWSVIGGNYQIPKMALDASGATVHSGKVVSVTRGESNNKTHYTLNYVESENNTSQTMSDFDVVIVAHPLNVSTVQFNQFPMTIYSDAAKTPYHRTVATFVKGQLNGKTFGLTGESYPRSFPLAILGTNLENPPVVFNSCSVNVPTTSSEEEAKNDYLQPLCDQPTRVWKVFSNQLLSESDKNTLFRRIDDVSVKDWLAYPEYDPPEEFPPFDLDGNGLLYINGIEKAASAMEMSAIGAKNVALLAKEYILAAKKNE